MYFYKSLVFRWLWIFILFPTYLWTHHTGTSHSPTATTRFIDPFTGKREKPANYLVLTQDYYKGTNENSNIYTTTAFIEFPFYDGRFALNGSVPWIYFQQRSRSDAARIGKPYLGAKWLPLGDFEKNYFIMLEGNIGFPSSNDTDRFTGGNYYSGQGFLTFGYLFGKWGIVLKGGGLKPLSKSQPYNLQDNDGIPYYLRSSIEKLPEPRYVLKKVTVYQAYLSYYMIPQISLFLGYLYRTPYQGIDFDNETKRTIPRIFTEGSLGFTYNFSEKYNLTVAYRYPFYQKKDHKLYEEVWTIAFSMEF